MNCPVCSRSLAPTLSICPTCGAMMNDTVREELQPKVTPGAAPRSEIKRPDTLVRPPAASPQPPMAAPQYAKRTETRGLNAAKTSPTLVEFQNKNASLPDWRLQLQNAVQQRKGGQVAIQNEPRPAMQFPANGAAAMRAEIAPAPEAAPESEISDPRVASAMRRIAESRKTFLEPEAKRPAKMRPFGVVAPNRMAAAAAAPARTVTAPKPKLVEPAPVAEKRDTNKLPPIEKVQDLSTITAEPVVIETDSATLPTEFAEIKRIRIRAEPVDDEAVEPSETLVDEIEDLAPLSMRFGAGLFDMIIGAFAAFLLLSPIAFTNGDWFTPAGLLTFAAAFGLVTFLYMTLCLGFFGKTMGMRLFSLELVDALENEYPTLRQAGVNSAVFLIVTPLVGAGFLTVFFNEEKRALHDLLSGTIIVREF
jgi:uncharacterized RDD family membrane protein YckC